MGGPRGGIIMKKVGIATEVLSSDAEVKVDMKMDKVRRLVGNRYGEEARLALMKLLDKVLVEYTIELQDKLENSDANIGIDEEELDLAKECLQDMVTRMEKEPVVRPVKADKE